MTSLSFNVRQTCLWIHRYTGLAMAAFLIITGVTGMLLAFHSELDDMFNHELTHIEAQQTPPLSIAALHDKVIATYPKQTFSSMPTSIAPDRAAVFSVDRMRGPQAKSQPKAPFQEVYIDPFSGEIIGTRDKDEWAWRNTMYKVFWLHRDLLMGDIGKLILGMVALIWTINCFIGFYLTFPRALKFSKANQDIHKKTTRKKRASFVKRWLPAWKIRRKTNTFKFNYDLHHAFGLWLWLMLLVIAWSSVGFNLRVVYQPVMQAAIGLEPREGRPTAKASSEPNSKPEAQTALKLGRSAEQMNGADDTLAIISPFNEPLRDDNIHAHVVTKSNSIAYLNRQAEIAAQENGVSVQQLLGIRWVDEDEQWQMRFKTDKDIGTHGGASSITIDAATGNVARVNFGYQSSFGNKTDQWLSTLHMGHISHGIGHVLYQIFLALIGLAVAVLSGTGGYLWWRSRQQRLKILQKLR